MLRHGHEYTWTIDWGGGGGGIILTGCHANEEK